MCYSSELTAFFKPQENSPELFTNFNNLFWFFFVGFELLVGELEKARKIFVDANLDKRLFEECLLDILLVLVV